MQFPNALRAPRCNFQYLILGFSTTYWKWPKYRKTQDYLQMLPLHMQMFKQNIAEKKYFFLKSKNQGLHN